MSDHDKIPIDELLVQQLIAEQFPRWADLEINPVEFSGWVIGTFHGKFDRTLIKFLGILIVILNRIHKKSLASHNNFLLTIRENEKNPSNNFAQVYTYIFYISRLK